MVDVRTLVETRYEQLSPGLFDAVLASPTELHPLATEVATGAAVDLAPTIVDPPSLRRALRASAGLPLLAGPPVAVDGRRFVDAGLAAAIPVRAAVKQGATHVLVLRSRRAGEAATAPGRVSGALGAALLRRIDPALARAFLARAPARPPTRRCWPATKPTPSCARTSSPCAQRRTRRSRRVWTRTSPWWPLAWRPDAWRSTPRSTRGPSVARNAHETWGGRYMSSLEPGATLPDYELPDHESVPRKLSELQGDDPMILTLARGHYCPKEHQQHLELAAHYPKINVAYTAIATISTDEHHTLQEFRNSVGAVWPFLSDPGRIVQKDLDIQEYTDPDNDPMIPHTLVLKPGLVIHRVYNGYWFWGRPSFAELRQDLRAASGEIRPDWDLSTPGLRERWDSGDMSPFHGWDKREASTTAPAALSGLSRQFGAPLRRQRATARRAPRRAWPTTPRIEPITSSGCSSWM